MSSNEYPRTTMAAVVHKVDVGSEKYPDDINSISLPIGITKGDIVVFERSSGYRNDGVTIYDGFRLIHLQFWPDDYGNLPSMFTPIEDGAPTDYWLKVDAIDHNTIIWVKRSTIQTGSFVTETDWGDHAVCVFTYKSKTYRIICDDPSTTLGQFKRYLLQPRESIPVNVLSDFFDVSYKPDTLYY